MNKTLGEAIVESKMSGNHENVAVLFYELNRNMKAHHSKGICLNGVDSNTRINSLTSSFLSSRKIYDQRDVQNDIYSLSLFAISSFVYLNSDAKQLVTLDRNVLVNNIEFVKEMVPPLMPGDSYHSDIVEGKVFTYYEDYIAELNNRIDRSVSNANSNNLTKVYSTSAGRAMTDKSNYDAAFVNVIFYPVMLAACLIVSAVVMVIINIIK